MIISLLEIFFNIVKKTVVSFFSIYLFLCNLKENFQVPHTYQPVTGVDSGNASDEDSQNQRITGCPVQREMLPRAVQQLVCDGNCHLNFCLSQRVRL